MTFGAALSVFLSTGVEALGPQFLLTAFGFVGGFSMVIFSQSFLFTEVNVVIPVTYMTWAERCVGCGRFWLTVFFANFFGAYRLSR